MCRRIGSAVICKKVAFAIWLVRMVNSSRPTQPNACGAISLDDGRRFRLLYFHPTVLRAEGCPGQLEPLTRRVDDVAAISTGAFNLPRVLLFAPAGVCYRPRSDEVYRVAAVLLLAI